MRRDQSGQGAGQAGGPAPRPTPGELGVPRVVPWPATEAEQAVVVAEAVAALRGGELVVLPTDTVYGLAAFPWLPAAIARVYAVKERPAEKRLPLLVDSVARARAVAQVPPVAEQLMARFWPGGLTLVLPARQGDDTLALRMPDHAVPLALIAALGEPLATTSANRSGQPSCTSAEGVLAQLSRGYALLIDGGAAPGGQDSTVLDLSGTMPRLLRVGAVPQAELKPVVGDLAES